MQFRFVEIRDEGTCIPALAIQMEAEDKTQDYYVHRRCGYPRDGRAIVLMHLYNQRATVDPYEWTSLGFGARTMPQAHYYIIEHFHELLDGDVIDVRMILGETTMPAISERFGHEDKGGK